MLMQQKEIDSLKKWLTNTEDRISKMSSVGPTLEHVKEQITRHQALQKDLEQEQCNIAKLNNMVVIVDEKNSNSASCQLEDELQALGERWSHVCRWSEEHWAKLRALEYHWQR